MIEQTHVRIYKSDKAKLRRYMKRKGMRGEATVIRLLFKRLKL